MKIQIITLFPEMFEKVLNTSMLWKAQDKKLVEYGMINLREFGQGPRRTVDDTPYGGGDGMVLMVEPLFAAVNQAKKNDPKAKVILMTPRGEMFDQAMAKKLADEEVSLILICGHYEGYDERITSLVDQQLSIGKYILTGGEIAAMAVIDAISRLIPGVLGGENSASEESYSLENTLEYPHYTRPEDFKGMKVPDVLLSGDHAKIAAWRRSQLKT